jgi:hypothetical protein
MILDKIFSLFRARIDAVITERIVLFYKNLVNQGQIKDVPMRNRDS